MHPTVLRFGVVAAFGVICAAGSVRHQPGFEVVADTELMSIRGGDQASGLVIAYGICEAQTAAASEYVNGWQCWGLPGAACVICHPYGLSHVGSPGTGFEERNDLQCDTQPMLIGTCNNPNGYYECYMPIVSDENCSGTYKKTGFQPIDP